MNKFTKILALSLCSIALLACDDIVAQPNKVLDGDKIVTNDGYKDNYFNNFEVVYNKLVDSGTSNNTIITELTTAIAKIELNKKYGFDTEVVFNNVTAELAGKAKTAYAADIKENAEAIEKIIYDRVTDTMIAKAKSDTYAVDKEFKEIKLVIELRSSLYDVEEKTETATHTFLITPTSEYNEIFTADYTDYIEKSIYPDVYKELLTSLYLLENEASSLGRAYAREVSYIKLENIENHKDSVPVLINSYFKAIDNGTAPTTAFDLESLARIYKGVTLEGTEGDFLASNPNVVTRQDIVAEELAKVCDAHGNLLAETDRNFDADLASEYTGSYTYLPKWGEELKNRELAQLDIVEEQDLVIKSNGVNDLPSALRERLFSSSVESYCETFKDIKFLTPESIINDANNDYLTKYAYYDSSSDAYYITIVGETYNTTKLNALEEDAPVKLNIANILGKTSTNQKEALLHYLEAYISEYGDQGFYDYIEANYGEILEDE